MLLQFSVENFRSIKNKAVLSLEASRDNEHPDHVAVLGDNRILRTISLFGANAAGKSNVFSALTAAIRLIRYSNNLQMNQPIPMIVPFRFSHETQEKPSSFEFVFVEKGKKYVYGFSATYQQIVREYLYVYNTARASTIFERDVANEQEYHFTNARIRKELEPIIVRNTKNKLFPSTATLWNARSTEDSFLWFSKIDTYPNNFEALIPKDVPMLEDDTGHELKKFIIDILKESDISISDYIFSSKETPIQKGADKFPEGPQGMVPRQILKEFTIETRHRVICEDNKTEEFTLDLHDESKGTQNLFMLSPVLYEAFKQGKVICVDEFDASLHPLLVTYLVGLFNNPRINTGNAQLIISVHSTILLSHRISRDDEIYFVEKERDTGASEVYSLDEFSPRKQLNVRKAYLLGRFGAVPEIGDGEILW